MLSLVRPPTGFTGRTAHGKSTWRAEDHIHIDRSHGVTGRGTVHLKGGRCGGDRSKVIAYHHGIIPVVLGFIYIVDYITVTRSPCDGLTIPVPLIG